MRKVYLDRGQTVVTESVLEHLEAKATAHDALMVTYQAMADEQSRLIHAAERTPHELGWLECFGQLNRGIVAASKRTVERVPRVKEYAVPQDRIASGRTRPTDDLDPLPF